MKHNIEAFKKMDSNEAIEFLFKDNCDLTQRIDKAVEYVKDKACYSDGHCKCSFSQMALDNVLNILKGDDTNE